MAICWSNLEKKLNEDSCVMKNSIHKLLWFLLQTFREFFWVVESEDILAQIVHWFRGETLAHQVDHGKALHDLRLSIRAHRSRSMPRCHALPVSQTKKVPLRPGDTAPVTQWSRLKLCNVACSCCSTGSIPNHETADDGSIRQNLRDLVISQRYHQTRHLTR